MEIIKQLGHMLSVLIVLSFVASVIELKTLSFSGFLVMLVIFAIIIFVNLFAKKLTAVYFQAEEESAIWSIERFGFKKHKYFSKAVPIGIVLPILFLILSLGTVPWYASMQSDIKPGRYKQVKRGGLLSFVEMSENDFALISAAGIISSLVLAFFAYLVNAPIISRLAIQFAFFNMIPISHLDGAKIFFGNRNLYIVLAVITLIALAYSFLLV